MLVTSQLKEVFTEKLISTGNVDEAFNKAIWIAYNHGLVDGLTDTRTDKSKVVANAQAFIDMARSKIESSNICFRPDKK